MKCTKSVFPRQNTGRARSPGSLEWLPGLFAVCLTSVLILCTMTVYRCRAVSDILEDALSESALAAALIDVRIYGSSHDLVIGDPESARNRYLEVLQANLGLDEELRPRENSLMGGPVILEDFCVYDLRGTVLSETRILADGRTQARNGTAGTLTAPNGQAVPSAGIYGEISFPVDLPFGLRVTARKGCLVTVNERNP